MTKKILDPCCGSRMFYFNPDNPTVDYRDSRKLQTTLCDGRPLVIEPDIMGDVLEIDAPDNSYPLVIFDPPHLTKGGDNSWQVLKYGKLPPNWRDWMTRAFAECWRVLSYNGTLVFKWYEYRIPLKDVIACAPAKPVLGNRRPIHSKTHWLLFLRRRNERHRSCQRLYIMPAFRAH